MDFRNKYLVRTIAVLLGLLFIFSGASGLYAGTHNMQGVPEDMKQMSQTLWDTGIFPLVKIAEILAGLMLVIGFLPWIGTIFLTIIAFGATVQNVRIAPEYTPVAAVCFVLTLYLVYAYWDKYKPLFTK